MQQQITALRRSTSSLLFHGTAAVVAICANGADEATVAFPLT